MLSHCLFLCWKYTLEQQFLSAATRHFKGWLLCKPRVSLCSWVLALDLSCLRRGTRLLSREASAMPGPAAALPSVESRCRPRTARSAPAWSLLAPFFFLSLWCCSTFFQHFLFHTKPKEYNPEQEVFITRDPSLGPTAGPCPRQGGLGAPSTAPSPRGLLQSCRGAGTRGSFPVAVLVAWETGVFQKPKERIPKQFVRRGSFSKSKDWAGQLGAGGGAKRWPRPRLSSRWPRAPGGAAPVVLQWSAFSQ